MTPTGWSTPADVRSEVLRRWDRGRLLADVAQPSDLFPLRVVLKRPTSAELGTRFDEVRAWVTGLQSIAQGRLESRQVNHRQLGANSAPTAMWFDTIDAAAATIGKTRDLQRFRALVELVQIKCPQLVPLLAKRPLEALAEVEEWPRLLEVAEWLVLHPRPNVYLRQVDVPGVHTKFIERYQRTLAAMLDIVLPETAIDATVSQADFVRRYGFRRRPRLVHFRYLDHSLGLTATDHDRQYALTAPDFGRIASPQRVFITENEINFLALPDAPGSMVIFGAGSGFEHFAEVPWLAGVPVHYWGDIDTHGMAILDQLRAFVPHAASMMMDRQTLIAHSDFWGTEDKPTRRDLIRLTEAERSVYDDLRDNRLRLNLRLEQERVRFGWVRDAVASAVACP